MDICDWRVAVRLLLWMMSWRDQLPEFAEEFPAPLAVWLLNRHVFGSQPPLGRSDLIETWLGREWKSKNFLANYYDAAFYEISSARSFYALPDSDDFIKNRINRVGPGEVNNEAFGSSSIGGLVDFEEFLSSLS